MPLGIICIRCGRAAKTTPCPECKRGDYYQTAAWKRLRAQAIRIAGACQLCNGTHRLTAHHRRNRRTKGGPDALSNLTVLCGRCHNQYEGDVRAGQPTEHRRKVDALPSVADLL